MIICHGKHATLGQSLDFTSIAEQLRWYSTTPKRTLAAGWVASQGCGGVVEMQVGKLGAGVWGPLAPAVGS